MLRPAPEGHRLVARRDQPFRILGENGHLAESAKIFSPLFYKK
jgi:hypothetical protein